MGRSVVPKWVFPAMRGGGRLVPLQFAASFLCSPRVRGWKGDYLRREAGDGVIPVMRGGGRFIRSCA